MTAAILKFEQFAQAVDIDPYFLPVRYRLGLIESEFLLGLIVATTSKPKIACALGISS